MGSDEEQQLHHQPQQPPPVVTHFSIELPEADEERIWHGGEVVRGKLLVELSEKTTLNQIKLQMKGRAVWIGDGTAKGDFEKVYFDQDMTLLERPPGRPEPGHFPWIANFMYSLPFECRLPKGCPTSYEGPFGSIRYYIKATLIEDETAHKKEHYVKKALMLVAPSEGEEGDCHGPPVSDSDSAFFGKCCCKGKVTAELSLSRSAFLPGDDIFGSIRVNGKKYSRALLDQLEIRLVDRVCRVGCPDKMGASPWRTLVARRPDKHSKTGSGGDALTDIFLISVPPVAPSTRGKFDTETGELLEMTPNGMGVSSTTNGSLASSLYESPSTATLRFRRQPFLRIQYAVQVSIANVLVLEAPITICELAVRSSTASKIVQPFIAGAQVIDEPADSGKIALGGPFSYTPVYPVRERVPETLPLQTALAVNGNGHHHELSPAKETIVVAEEKQPLLSEMNDRVLEKGFVQTSDSALPNAAVVSREERIVEVKNENFDALTTVTTTVKATSDEEGHEVVCTSGAGDLVNEMKERLEDGGGAEGREGETTREVTTVEMGDDGIAVTTTSTTTLLTRTRRSVEQEDQVVVEAKDEEVIPPEEEEEEVAVKQEIELPEMSAPEEINQAQPVVEEIAPQPPVELPDEPVEEVAYNENEEDVIEGMNGEGEEGAEMESEKIGEGEERQEDEGEGEREEGAMGDGRSKRKQRICTEEEMAAMAEAATADE